MKIIQIAKGIHGVRQLAAARANIELRKRGALPKIKEKTNGTHRPWTDEEYDTAVALRLAGRSNREIGIAINRTANGVNRAIGHQFRSRWEMERASQTRQSGSMVSA